MLKKENFLALFWFLLLFSLILFIRSNRISEESLYGDEPYSVFHAQKTLSELKEIFLHDQNPPLQIALLHFWLKIFGLSDVSAKMFSVFCSVFAGLILFFFCKKYLNKFSSLLAFFFFLFSNSQQYFATEARPYPLIQLLCILSLYAYFSILEKPQKRYVFLLFFTNLALLFTHYVSVFILLVEFLFIWFYFNKNRKSFIYYFISQTLLVIAFIPWISVLLSNLPKEGSFWNHAPNYEELRWHTNVLVGNEALFYLFNGLLLLFLILLIFNRYKPILRKDFNLIYFSFFLCLYILPIVLDYIVSQKTPVFLTRYILYTTFGLFLSVSYFVSKLELRPAYKCIFISPLLLTVIFSFKIKQEREDDWKSLVPIVKSKIGDRTIVFICANYKAKDFAFYYDIESFKNYKFISESLNLKGVFFNPNDTGLGVENLQYDSIEKIIYVHSHSEFRDPNHDIEKYFLAKGFTETYFYKKINTGFTEFRKNSMSLNRFMLLKEYPFDVCDFIIKQKVLRNETDTCLLFQSNLNDNVCQNSQIELKDSVYGLKANLAQQYNMGVLSDFSEFSQYNVFSVTADIFNEGANKIYWVLSIESNDKVYYRNEVDIKARVTKNNRWENFYFSSTLPDQIPENAILKMYFWTPDEKNVLLSNAKIVLSDD